MNVIIGLNKMIKKLLLFFTLFLVSISSTYAETDSDYTDGLLNYISYDTDERNSTTVFDTSGFENDGVITGNTATVTGAYKQAAYFQGSNDYITIPAGAYVEFGAEDFTLSFWFNRSNTARGALFAATVDYKFGVDVDSIGGEKMGLWASSNGANWNMINADGGGNGIGSTSTTSNVWYHYVVVRTGSSWITYINGAVDDTITAAGTVIATSLGRKMGEWGQGGFDFTGAFDEFAIWNRTMNATDVLYLKNNPGIIEEQLGGPTAPVVSNTWGTPNATTNYVNTNITFDWGNCTGGAGTGVYNYSFYLNDTLQYFGTSSNWTSGFTLQQNYTYNYYCSDANNLSSANSTQRWVIYDYATPEISNVVKPTTTINVIDYFNFTLTDNIGLYQYEINLTYASNGTQINYTKDTTLSGKEANISYVLNHTNIPFAKLNVKLNYSDTSTDSIFNGLDWSYSNGEITFYNPDDEAENIILDFGYYSNNEVHRLTTTQIQNYNVQKVINKKRDRFEFGAVFDLPNTDFIFGFRIPKKSDMNLYSEEDLHFIMYDKYWMDFDTYIGKNGIYKKFNASMKQDDNYYYVYYNIDWENYNVEAGDRITFITKSIGGLNFNSYEFDYYYVDTPIPVFQYGKLNSFSSSDINWTIDLLILNNKTSSLTINITPDPNLGSMFQTTIAAYGYYKKTYYNITSLTSANTWLNFTGFNVNHTFGGLITTSDALSLITPSNGTGSGSGLISCISTIGAGCGVSFTDDCAVIS